MLARDLSMARRLLPGQPRDALPRERATAARTACWRGPRIRCGADLRTLLVEDMPAMTRELAPYIAAVTSLFVLSGLAGAG